MPDPRIRVVPDDDYGEAKTRQQDATDSSAMLGLVILLIVIVLAVIAGVGIALVLW